MKIKNIEINGVAEKPSRENKKNTNMSKYYIVKFKDVYCEDYLDVTLELKENILHYAKLNYYDEVENAFKNNKIVLDDGEYTFNLFSANNMKIVQSGGQFRIVNGKFYMI